MPSNVHSCSMNEDQQIHIFIIPHGRYHLKFCSFNSSLSVETVCSQTYDWGQVAIFIPHDLAFLAVDY